MALAEALLLERTRTAYERGRLFAGLRTSAVVAPMAAASWILCGRPAATALGMLALAVLVTRLVVRGGDLARGARVGLWAGLPPLALPMAAMTVGHACGAAFCAYYPALCLIGGVAGGGLVTWIAPGRRASPAAAVAVAVLAGTLGCLIAGAVGVLVLILGMAIGAGPVLVQKRA